MACDVRQQQLADAIRRLVGRKVADAGQHFEAIGRGDEIHRAFGGGPPDGVIGIAATTDRTLTSKQAVLTFP
jgi:hypothetical protein